MKLIKDFAVLLSVAFVAFAFSNGVFPLFAQVDSASHLPFQESMRQDDTSKKFVWGPEEKKSYSQRKLDPQAWNMEMLGERSVNYTFFAVRSARRISSIVQRWVGLARSQMSVSVRSSAR
jgi:hypothetical protein